MSEKISWSLLVAAAYNYVIEFYQPKLKPTELKVLLYIMRQTIGWRNLEAWISPSAMIKGSGCGRVSISKALEVLCKLELIEIRCDFEHYDRMAQYGITMGLLDTPHKRQVYGWIYKDEVKYWYSPHIKFTRAVSDWIDKNGKISGDK